MTTKNMGGQSGSQSNQQGGRGVGGGKSGHSGQSGAERKNMMKPAGDQPSGSELDAKHKDNSKSHS